MTTANIDAIFRRHTNEEALPVRPGVARMGKWTFTPASSDRTRGENASLHHEGRKIELNYSSSIFEDFLKAISKIHHEFNRRSQDVAASGTSGMCTDGQVRQGPRV